MKEETRLLIEALTRVTNTKPQYSNVGGTMEAQFQQWFEGEEILGYVLTVTDENVSSFVEYRNSVEHDHGKPGEELAQDIMEAILQS